MAEDERDGSELTIRGDWRDAHLEHSSMLGCFSLKVKLT